MNFGKMTAIAIAASVVAGPAYAYDDKDVIDYRQHIMKVLDAQTASVGMLVSTLITNDNLVAHLDAIAATAKAATKSFEPKVLGGESSPEVWAKWDDFKKRMDDMATKTAALAETARAHGQDAIMADMVAAFSCKSCHDLYRIKK